MNAVRSKLSPLAFAAALLLAATAHAQPRPYLGYAYPAGGQQTTTFQVKIGGQQLDDVAAAIITGSGVTARVVDYQRRLNPQEIQLLREQVKELRSSARGSEKSLDSSARLVERIDQRIRDYVPQPACSSISNIVFLEVTVSPEAEPGARELRLVTARGVSNPLVFEVGQLDEHTRKPMLTATLHVLGKEAAMLRNRPESEMEARVTIPCTLNGQIAAREVNRYRFSASKGQRLVINTHARQLIPYVADAVPGWFQPVITLYDAQGRELAFDDDYQFNPDPVIMYQVKDDGDYVLEIRDSLYRGREDFIYRISIGELPFVTSVFPLGATVGAVLPPDMSGWNVDDADLRPPPFNGRAGLCQLTASRLGLDSNPLPFVLDTLPATLEREANDSVATAQRVTLPAIVNGRIGCADDWDVYQFAGKKNDAIVAEVQARRLQSPLDSELKLTDATGRIIAFNDDREDLTAGVNTHHADSYLTAKLPADGTYYVHIGDTARKGGVDYGYRLRISAPQPDFELRLLPSSVSVATNSTAAVTVYVSRKDGFTGPIKLALQDPPAGITAAPVTLGSTQNIARFTFKSSGTATREPQRLVIAGTAKIGNDEITRTAVATEDRMQAFLWRHLVPASELLVMVFDPKIPPPVKREPPPHVRTESILAAMPAPNLTNSAPPPAAAPRPAESPKPKFTKGQIAGRLRQLKLLYEEGLLTDAFYDEKVGECDTPTP